jgi:signal peptidase I
VRPITRKIAIDYGGAILAAVIVAVFIRIFVIEAYRIPTSAMHPTLEPGDTIFVAKWPLGFNRKIERGDVLVFASPAEPDRDYIKRVLGVTGDTVDVKKGRVTLNGKPLALPDSHKDAACGREAVPVEGGTRLHDLCWEPPLNEDFGPEKVPENSVFVIGDLRSQSPADAKKRRTWGIFPLEAVKGKAKWIWLSIEPHNPGISAVRFPNFRFERMFRRIE